MRIINYIVDDINWVQAQRAKDLQPYLKNIKLLINTPKSFMSQAAPEVSRGVPVWVASWRMFLSNPELEKYIEFSKCAVGVMGHYNLGGGLKPSTCFRKGSNPEEEHEKAIKLLSKPKVVMCNSKILYDFLSNDIKHLYLTQNGVDSNFFVPNRVLPRKPIKVGWVGKVKEAKNYRLLSQTLRRLSKQSNVTFFPVVVDKNNPYPLSRKEMLFYYQSIDFYVNFSLHEGCPNSILEAGSCGIPIISTRVGIAPELVDHLQSGYFIEPTEESLKDRLETLPEITEPWYHVLSMRLRNEIVKKWDWSQRVGAIENALKEIL